MYKILKNLYLHILDKHLLHLYEMHHNDCICLIP